jgi:virginiamycin B lyase
MRHPLFAVAGVAAAMALPSTTSAQAPVAALTGLVSSAEEPAMKGVLVSAAKAGSNITVTVVTGADGRYSFPANRLGPGQYAIAVRAVGYELDQPQTIENKAGRS